MKFRYWRVTVLAVVMVLLAPMAAIAADQTVEVNVLAAGTLAIDVEHDFGLGVAVPGATTAENGFHMYITNVSSGGWEVTVESTDLTSFNRENCEEWGCDRVDTDPLYTIDASNLYFKGGDADHWGDPGAVTGHTTFLAGAGTPEKILEGTADAYGAFDISEPHTSVQVTVPALQAIAEYWATLTYTIMAPTP